MCTLTAKTGANLLREARLGLDHHHADVERATSATLVDTGFGANVPVKAAFATKGVVLESATDADGRVSVTFPPQSGVVVVPA